MKKMTDHDIQELLDDIDRFFEEWHSEHFKGIGNQVKTIIKEHLEVE